MYINIDLTLGNAEKMKDIFYAWFKMAMILNDCSVWSGSIWFQDAAMEMKKINSGKLRAIGYDSRARMLQVQLADGSTLQYSGVGEEAWRSLSSSGAAWSYYRDNIEEEFTAKRVSGSAPAAKNPLDELFRKPEK